MKVAILISGRGSNMQALIEACAEEDFPAEIALVLSNRPKAKGLKRAEKAGIETAVVNHEDFETREAFEAALDARLREAGVDLICMAGFMRLLNPEFVESWRDQILNIHPSLLPAFRGLNSHERALEAGVRIHGCTVHYVREDMDDGPIVGQAAVPVFEDDEADALSERVLAAEHILYPECLRRVAEGSAIVRREKVVMDFTKKDAAARPLIIPSPPSE